MTDVFETMGKLDIVQSRTVGNSDGDALSYIIHTTLSNPTNFSAILSAKKPDRLFLYQNNEYVRLVTLDDFNLYPADYPNELGGYYRAREVTRTYTSDVDAASYANALYEAITKLLLVMHDYEVTLTDFTESDTVPNQDRSTLYNTIQLYEATQSQLDDINIQILTKQAAIDAFTAVVTLNDLTSTIAEPEKAPEKLQRISLNLTTVRTRLDAINTAPSYSLKTTSDYFTAYGVPAIANARKSTVLTNVNDIYLQVALLVGNGTTDDAVLTAIRALQTPTLDSLTSLESAVVQISSDISTYIPAVKTASLTMVQATDTIAADQTLVNDNVATIDKGLRIKAINQSKLQELHTQYVADMEALKKQKDSLLATKQKYSATLVMLEPSINLLDPMTIYTHRIFKRPPS
jgi:hypothetical protein